MIKSKQGRLGALILFVIIAIIVGFNLIKNYVPKSINKQEVIATRQNKLGKVDSIEYDYKSDKYVITIVFDRTEHSNQNLPSSAFSDTVTITVEEDLLKPVLKNYEIPETISALKNFMLDEDEAEITQDQAAQLKSEEAAETKAHYTDLSSNQAQSNISKQNFDLADATGIVFKVQFLMSRTKLEPGNAKLEGIDNISSYYADRHFKYMAGSAKSFWEAKQTLVRVLPIYPEAFIVAFYNNERIPVLEAKKILRDSRK